MAGEVAARREQRIGIEAQLAGSDLGRVLQFERATGSVAGVGQQSLAVLLALGVQLGKNGQGHKHLTAHFEILGLVGAGTQSQRQRANGPDVGRHHVAPGTVAAGYALRELTVLVPQTHGHAVDFQLANIRVGRAFEAFLHPLIKLAQVVFRVGVAQAEHGVAVLSRGKLLADGAAHAAGGRVGLGQIGKLGFELL